MTTNEPLPVREPQPGPDDQPFWDAAAEGRLVLPRCRACGTYVWYPRTFCPDCRTFGVDWVPATGRGTIYSFTVSHTRQGAVGPARTVRHRLRRAGRRAAGDDKHRRRRPRSRADRRCRHCGVRARRRHQGPPLHPGWLTSCSTPLAPPGRRQAGGRSSPEGKDSTPMGRTSS